MMPDVDQMGAIQKRSSKIFQVALKFILATR